MALPNYKDIIDLIKQGATSEAQEKILALREGALALQEENINLKEEIADLKNQMQEASQMVFDGEVYWREAEEKKEGPFCSTCFDVDNRKVRLHEDGPGWWCNKCKLHFGPSSKRSFTL